MSVLMNLTTPVPKISAIANVKETPCSTQQLEILLRRILPFHPVPSVSNLILIARTFDLVITLFDCIRQWFKVGKVCPLCKQHVTSVVYNVGEKSGTFLEYNFNGLPHIPEAIYEQAVRSAPSQTSPSETAGQRALTHRRRIYHDSMIPDPGYPSVSRRHLNTTYVLPYHIAKVRT